MSFTNRQMYETIISRLGGGPITFELQPTNDEICQFCAERIALLDKVNEKAKEKRVEAAESDEMLNAVYEAVKTDDYRCIDDIVSDVCIAHPDASAAKVISRLSKLIISGKVEKMNGFIADSEGKKRKAMMYRAII